MVEIDTFAESVLDELVVLSKASAVRSIASRVLFRSAVLVKLLSLSVVKTLSDEVVVLNNVVVVVIPVVDDVVFEVDSVFSTLMVRGTLVEVEVDDSIDCFSKGIAVLVCTSVVVMVVVEAVAFEVVIVVDVVQTEVVGVVDVVVVEGVEVVEVEVVIVQVFVVEVVEVDVVRLGT